MRRSLCPTRMKRNSSVRSPKSNAASSFRQRNCSRAFANTAEHDAARHGLDARGSNTRARSFDFRATTSGRCCKFATFAVFGFVRPPPFDSHKPALVHTILTPRRTQQPRPALMVVCARRPPSKADAYVPCTTPPRRQSVRCSRRRTTRISVRRAPRATARAVAFETERGRLSYIHPSLGRPYRTVAIRSNRRPRSR